MGLAVAKRKNTRSDVALAERITRDVKKAFMPFFAEMGVRFNEIDKRFDGMDKRFDEIDVRFEGVDKRFDGIDVRFDGVDKRFDGVDKRFDGVDKRIDGVDKRIDGIDVRIDGLDKRIDRVESRLSATELEIRGVGILMEQMNKKIDVALDVSKLITGQNMALKDHENRITNLEADSRSMHKVLDLIKE
jgi:archaellum component FlaC